MANPAQRIIEAVMDEIGAETPTDLARSLDLGVHGYGKAHRWISGVSAPDFEATMTMLSRAGFLHPAAEAAWRGISLEEAVRAVEKARAAATAEAARRLAGREEQPRDRRRTA